MFRCKIIRANGFFHVKILFAFDSLLDESLICIRRRFPFSVQLNFLFNKIEIIWPFIAEHFCRRTLSLQKQNQKQEKQKESKAIFFASFLLFRPTSLDFNCFVRDATKINRNTNHTPEYCILCYIHTKSIYIHPLYFLFCCFGHNAYKLQMPSYHVRVS